MISQKLSYTYKKLFVIYHPEFCGVLKKYDINGICHINIVINLKSLAPNSNRFSLYTCTLSCSTLYNPMDWSPPGFSVQGILQPRILGWVAFCPPGYLPNPGKELMSPESPALQADSLPLSHQGNLYPVDSPVSILFLNFNFNVVTSLSVRNSGRGRRDYYPESVNMTSTSVAL